MNAREVGIASVWLLAAGLVAAAAGEQEASMQPAASQPANRPMADGSAMGLRANLRRLREVERAPLQDTASGELQRMIMELQSIRVSPRRRGKSPLAAVAVLGPTSRPATTQPAATQPVRVVRALPKDIIEQLKNLPPGCLSRPVAVGDELYRNDYLKAAFVVYERAMNGEADADTKSWCLYQMGNCRRETHSPEAETLYRRVTAEHGQTLWAQAAAIELKLLQWKRANRPTELLKSVEPINLQTHPAATTRPAVTTRPAATTRPTVTTRPAATTRPAVTTRPASSQPAIAASKP